jgi:uncharacterized membrane protein
MIEKNLELERLVFYSDAIVAVAITLPALDLKIVKTASGHSDELLFNVKKIDTSLLWFNIGWLPFIVTLPDSSSPASEYFFNKASSFIYSANVLFITIFQNNIRDYALGKQTHIKDNKGTDEVRAYRVACNVATFNALAVTLLSFFYPPAAFITIVVRLATIIPANRFFVNKRIRK